MRISQSVRVIACNLYRLIPILSNNTFVTLEKTEGKKQRLWYIICYDSKWQKTCEVDDSKIEKVYPYRPRTSKRLFRS